MAIKQFLVATICPHGRRDIKAGILAACISAHKDIALVVEDVLHIWELRNVNFMAAKTVKRMANSTHVLANVATFSETRPV